MRWWGGGGCIVRVVILIFIDIGVLSEVLYIAGLINIHGYRVITIRKTTRLAWSTLGIS